MSDIEDPYKSRGIITLKIENLSQFPTSGPETDTCRYSDIVYLRGLPWNIRAWGREIGDDEPPLKCICCVLECNKENTDPDWSCGWDAMLSTNKEQEYTAEEGSFVFNADEHNYFGFGNMLIEDLMNNEQFGGYDEETDSLTIYVHVIAQEPRGLKNVPDIVYKEYSIRSEHSLFVDFKDDNGNNYYKSNLVIDDKSWSFIYSPLEKALSLGMSALSSDKSTTIAECIFWLWNGKEVVILKKTLHAFGAVSSKIVVPTTANNSLSGAIGAYDFVPVNNKFNVVIRLLDKRIASENRMDSYYNDYECGLETVTLSITGTEKASFTVPKVDLFRASPVFRRMFSTEMTEKATGKVEIPDTNPEEFGEFLKAISPRQEHPNPSNVFALLKLAHLYECQTLLDRCEKHLMNCVEIPLTEQLTFADFYGLNKLQKNLVMKLNVANLSTLHHISKPHITLGSWLRK